LTNSLSAVANAPEIVQVIVLAMNGGSAIGDHHSPGAQALTKARPSPLLVVERLTMRAHEFILERYQGGLRKWFRQKWVNIGKKKKGGGHPECGTSGEQRGYAKCVPAAKARSMSATEKKSAVSRKRAAQSAAGRAGKSSGGSGKAPIRVSTAPKK
jgi:hypothetical protein